MQLFSFLLEVILISLSGVMAPGPMTAVVLSRGVNSPHAGARISLGHALVEIPLILLLMLGLGHFLEIQYIKPSISIIGSLLLINLGWQMWKNSSSPQIPSPNLKASDLKAGMLLSLSNPFFILWWATLGLALISKAREFQTLGITLFILIHWLCDLIWFWILSYISYRGKNFFGLAFQKYLFVICGGFLFYLAWVFLNNGLKNLNLLN
jgi:threonine/homoserine/homoserine lactone efflux protein